MAAPADVQTGNLILAADWNALIDYIESGHTHDGTDGSPTIAATSFTGVATRSANLTLNDSVTLGFGTSAGEGVIASNGTRIKIGSVAGKDIEIGDDVTVIAIKGDGTVDFQNATSLLNFVEDGWDIDSNGLILDTTSSNISLMVRNSTNNGVGHVGNNSSVSVADDETFTFTLSDGGLFMVKDGSNGNIGVFVASRDSATIVKVGDPGGNYDITDIDSNPGIAVFKSAASNVISVKNYTNGTINLTVFAMNNVSAATAPA